MGTDTTMANKVSKKLDEVHECIFQLRKIDNTQSEELRDRVSNITIQISLQRQFDEILELLEQKRPLPVRRISFTLKKLFDGKEQSKLQWQQLRNLDFNSLIFCMLAIQGLLSLPSSHFNWLVGNIDHYLKAQEFSTNLITIDQVQRVIRSMRREESTKEFLEGKNFGCSERTYAYSTSAYHKLEIQLCHEDGPDEEPSRKRSRIEGRPTLVNT